MLGTPAIIANIDLKIKSAVGTAGLSFIPLSQQEEWEKRNLSTDELC